MVVLLPDILKIPTISAASIIINTKEINYKRVKLVSFKYVIESNKNFGIIVFSLLTSVSSSTLNILVFDLYKQLRIFLKNAFKKQTLKSTFSKATVFLFELVLFVLLAIKVLKLTLLRK